MKTIRSGARFRDDELAPHVLAVGDRSSSDSCRFLGIHFGDADREAFRPPPVFHVLWISERLPHEITRRVEHARNDELPIRSFLRIIIVLRPCSSLFLQLL